MVPINGRAETPCGEAAIAIIDATSKQRTAPEIKELIAKLEVPFHLSVIEWRVINTTKSGKPRGQMIPYADQRAYTDRLNQLCTPAGWTRRYVVHISTNLQRGKDQKTVAKVVVTCELQIVGLGSHSATGEKWADDDNAATSAEAQAFKRACSCFGLGRYLYYFSGLWVDMDERKRPKRLPKLQDWATPDGWLKGLRPGSSPEQCAPFPESQRAVPTHREPIADGNAVDLIRQIEALREPLGRGLYRGLLRTIARAWQPSAIQDIAVQRIVLKHMQAAQRGLLRLDAALNTVGQGALPAVLRNVNLHSLAQVGDLKTLEQIVLALENLAGETSNYSYPAQKPLT